jgi:hypothetical protein
VSITDELDAKHASEAQAKIEQGLVYITHDGDGKPYVYMAYSVAGLTGGWGARFGPFATEDEAGSFIDAGSFIANYRAGHGVWKVGYRLRYVGKGPNMVQDCPLGTEAVIIGDNGYDYRYTLQFERRTPCVISSRHPDGEYMHKTWRTGGSGWERVTDNKEDT